MKIDYQRTTTHLIITAELVIEESGKPNNPITLKGQVKVPRSDLVSQKSVNLSAVSVKSTLLAQMQHQLRRSVEDQMLVALEQGMSEIARPIDGDGGAGLLAGIPGTKPPH